MFSCFLQEPIMQRARNNGIFLGTVSVVALVVSSTSNATTVTFPFFGTVESFGGPTESGIPTVTEGVPNGIAIGDRVVGEFSYETDAATNVTGTGNPGGGATAAYSFASIPGDARLSYSIGNYTWISNGNYTVKISDNVQFDTGGTLDGISVLASASGPATPRPGGPILVGGTGGTELSFGVEGQQNIISSTALPITLDNLNTQNSTVRGTITSGSMDPAFYLPYRINFAIDLPTQSPTDDDQTTTQIPDIPVESFASSFLVNKPAVDNILIPSASGDLGEFEYQFDWGFSNETLSYSVDIQLTGDIEAARPYIPIWEAGIERIWSDGAKFTLGSEVYNFAFDVNFVEGPGDRVVEVKNDKGRTDTDTWYLDLSEMGWTQDHHDETAAHEFGHYLGLYDEYVGGFTELTAEYSDLCRPSSVFGLDIGPGVGTFCNSLMADHGPVQERYYERLLEILDGRVDGQLGVAMSPVNYYPFDENRQVLTNIEFGDSSSISAVPLPSSGLVLASALLGLFGLVRVFKFRSPKIVV
jgi:hypothetical protein